MRKEKKLRLVKSDVYHFRVSLTRREQAAAFAGENEPPRDTAVPIFCAPASADC